MALNRRGFLAGCASVLAARGVPVVMKPSGGRRVLTLVYDQSLGMMRAIDRIVP
ncbi:Tat pathway signal protein [Rhodobacteraceae bacterium]|nr:Tat pathway signal protein [Paracoccaceae bacterium]